MAMIKRKREKKRWDNPILVRGARKAMDATRQIKRQQGSGTERWQSSGFRWLVQVRVLFLE
jgi:hypothetical protein